MTVILETIKEVFEPMVLVFFISLSAYCLFVDVPILKRKKLAREAAVFIVISWISAFIYMGMLALVILTK